MDAGLPPLPPMTPYFRINPGDLEHIKQRHVDHVYNLWMYDFDFNPTRGVFDNDFLRRFDITIDLALNKIAEHVYRNGNIGWVLNQNDGTLTMMGAYFNFREYKPLTALTTRLGQYLPTPVTTGMNAQGEVFKGVKVIGKIVKVGTTRYFDVSTMFPCGTVKELEFTPEQTLSCRDFPGYFSFM